MKSKSAVTIDHNEIRNWAEARGGKPSKVIETGRGHDPGLLRIDFPGYRGEHKLQEISWDEFFEKFDEKGLAFLHQDQTASGGTSRFFKLISRGSLAQPATQARALNDEELDLLEEDLDDELESGEITARKKAA